MPRVYKFNAVAFKENFSKYPDYLKKSDTPGLYFGQYNGKNVYAYPFGALVFVDIPFEDKLHVINDVSSFLDKPKDGKQVSHECESFIVHDDEVEWNYVKIDKASVVINEMTQNREQAIALLLAQSVAMEVYEKLVMAELEEVEKLIDVLAAKGSVRQSSKKLYKKLGTAMSLHNDVLGVLHLLDMPDIIWEDNEMARAYPEIRAIFDLDERYQALRTRLQTIQQSLEFLAGAVKDSHSFRVEFAIMMLIVFEIVMSFIKV
jgi:uncharacterized Rmd1/YagE family protein